MEYKNKLFINNEWIGPYEGEFIGTYNPANLVKISEIPRGKFGDVSLAAEAAKIALSGEWRNYTPQDRGNLLLRFAEIIRNNYKELGKIECLEMGRPIKESEEEIKSVADCISYNAGAADKLEGKVIPVGNNFVDFTELKPVGVTGHIVPWNFPLGMAFRSIAPALAAGCTVVLKPDENSSLSSLALGDLICDAGFPKGVFNIVTGYGEEAGLHMCENKLINHITFTGSVETGRKVYKNSTNTFKTVVLELGGKNPMIVFDDADVDRAVNDAIKGAFSNSGQVCSSSSRFIIHDNIFDQFISKFKIHISNLKIGNPLENPDLGPVVSENQYKKITGLMSNAIQGGADVICGGNPLQGSLGGYFIEPTLFNNVDDSLSLAKEEVFGPVAISYKFNTTKEAVNLANCLDTGLVAGVYTRDLSKALVLKDELDFGSVWINGWFIGGLQAPNGGVKNSGFGRERGLPGLMNYVSIKNIGICK
ncbi:MAG: aldehyde dehydrogenase family protein [SAR324 cluster bacterium]|nr:aldehyde dehydrogenase family protein [SAR324 cluster bacterium]